MMRHNINAHDIVSISIEPHLRRDKTVGWVDIILKDSEGHNMTITAFRESKLGTHLDIHIREDESESEGSGSVTE